MLENYIPPYNATVVEKLNEEGAVILGKTNLDEFAMGGTTDFLLSMRPVTPGIWSMFPEVPAAVQAAAVAAGEAAAALGYRYRRSIRQPAGFCGLVGLKPTYGTVSRYGLLAYAFWTRLAPSPGMWRMLPCS